MTAVSVPVRLRHPGAGTAPIRLSREGARAQARPASIATFWHHPCGASRSILLSHHRSPLSLTSATRTTLRSIRPWFAEPVLLASRSDGALRFLRRDRSSISGCVCQSTAGAGAGGRWLRHLGPLPSARLGREFPANPAMAAAHARAASRSVLLPTARGLGVGSAALNRAALAPQGALAWRDKPKCALTCQRSSRCGRTAGQHKGRFSLASPISDASSRRVHALRTTAARFRHITTSASASRAALSRLIDEAMAEKNCGFRRTVPNRA